jgi:hypothetical protein
MLLRLQAISWQDNVFVESPFGLCRVSVFTDRGAGRHPKEHVLRWSPLGTAPYPISPQWQVIEAS